MDKSQIRKEIAALINSIKEHSDNIGEKEHIPQLELELILHKIEKLYQKSIVFNHLNTYPGAPPVTPKVQELNPPVKAEQKETVKKEEPKPEIVKPVDLFGSEISPAEKAKQEK